MLKLYHDDKLLQEYPDTTPMLIFTDNSVQLLAHKDVTSTEDSKTLFQLATAIHYLCGDDEEFIKDTMERFHKAVITDMDSASDVMQ